MKKALAALLSLQLLWFCLCEQGEHFDADEDLTADRFDDDASCLELESVVLAKDTEVQRLNGEVERLHEEVQRLNGEVEKLASLREADHKAHEKEQEIACNGMLEDSENMVEHLSSNIYDFEITALAMLSVRLPKPKIREQRQSVKTEDLPSSSTSNRRHRRRPVTTLAIAATSNKELVVFSTTSPKNQEILAVFPTDHQEEIKVIDVSGSTADENLVMTGSSDGLVRIFTVSAWLETVEEIIDDDDNFTPKVTQKLRAKLLLDTAIDGFYAEEKTTGIEKSENGNSENEKEFLTTVELMPAKRRMVIGGSSEEEDPTLPPIGGSSVTDEISGSLEVKDPIIEVADLSEASAVNAVVIYKKRYLKTFVVGYDNGMIGIFKRNGTLKNQLNTNNSTVTALAINSEQTLAFSTEVGIHFMKIFRSKTHGQMCSLHSSNGQEEGESDGEMEEPPRVFSLIYDVHFPHILYAGTSDGRILIYNSAKRSRTKKCYPTDILIIDGSSNIRVSSVKGYLLASSNSGMHVFNVTGHTYRKPRFQLQSDAKFQTSPTLFAQSVDFYKKSFSVIAENLGADQTEEGKRQSSVSVMQSFFRYEPEISRFGFGRSPLLIAGVLIVFFYQFFWKKQRKNRISTFDDFDDPLVMKDYANRNPSGGGGGNLTPGRPRTSGLGIGLGSRMNRRRRHPFLSQRQQNSFVDDLDVTIGDTDDLHIMPYGNAGTTSVSTTSNSSFPDFPSPPYLPEPASLHLDSPDDLLQDIHEVDGHKDHMEMEMDMDGGDVQNNDSVPPRTLQ